MDDTQKSKMNTLLLETEGKAVIFSKTSCPFCTQAKKVLRETYKGEVVVWEINIENNTPAIQTALAKYAGGEKTVPQIFINKEHVRGGCSGLMDMKREGRMLPLK